MVPASPFIASLTAITPGRWRTFNPPGDVPEALNIIGTGLR